jgi:voltage-gated potassium channel
MTLRKALSEALDPSVRAEKGLSTTNICIVVLICLSIALGVAETEAALTTGLEHYYEAAHLIFFVIFLVEYAARIYAAPENPQYRSSLAYAFTFSSILDLLVVVSFVLPFFGLEASLLRIFRAVRLVRLARMGRYSIALQMIYQAMTERRYELGVSLVIAFGLMLLASSALYFAERTVQPDAFGSIPRALWWSVATLTTVGYGDIVPVTIFGRIAAGLTAIAGIGLIALPTGILAGAFSDGLSRVRKKGR